MNREEILNKSRKEGKGKTDERDQAITQKSQAISQAIGLLGCLTIAMFAEEQFSTCAWMLYCLMLASETIAAAILYKKSVWRWIFAAVSLAAFIFWVLTFVKVIPA